MGNSGHRGGKGRDILCDNDTVFLLGNGQNGLVVLSAQVFTFDHGLYIHSTADKPVCQSRGIVFVQQKGEFSGACLIH